MNAHTWQELTTELVGITANSKRVKIQFYLFDIPEGHSIQEVVAASREKKELRFPTEHELRQIFAGRESAFMYSLVVSICGDTQPDTEGYIQVDQCPVSGIVSEKIKAEALQKGFALIMVRV